MMFHTLNPPILMQRSDRTAIINALQYVATHLDKIGMPDAAKHRRDLAMRIANGALLEIRE